MKRLLIFVFIGNCRAHDPQESRSLARFAYSQPFNSLKPLALFFSTIRPAKAWQLAAPDMRNFHDAPSSWRANIGTRISGPKLGRCAKLSKKALGRQQFPPRMSDLDANIEKLETKRRKLNGKMKQLEAELAANEAALAEALALREQQSQSEMLGAGSPTQSKQWSNRRLIPKEEMLAASEGHEVHVKYRGTLSDGAEFDSKEDYLILGAGTLPAVVEEALYGMREAEKKTVVVPPEKGFGVRRSDLVFAVEGQGLTLGRRVPLDVAGERMNARVTEVKPDGTATLDANPEFAGETLTYDIEVLHITVPPKRGLTVVGWGGSQVALPFAIAEDPLLLPSPLSWPYQAHNFQRENEEDDAVFHKVPKFFTSMDDQAICALGEFYENQFAVAPQGEFSVLDLCGSFASYYPPDLPAKRVAVMGMVQEELAANRDATEYVTKDLNVDPTLPYGDGDFDIVTCSNSIGYLTRPQEVFAELHRVLKPGGIATISFSNRGYLEKLIAMWREQLLNDKSDGQSLCEIVGNYFRFSPAGGWRDISAMDISPSPGRGDPLWVVTALRA